MRKDYSSLGMGSIHLLAAIVLGLAGSELALVLSQFIGGLVYGAIYLVMEA